MKARPRWSWKDVQHAPSVAPATYSMRVPLDHDTYQRLCVIAAEAEQTPSVCAASMLRELVADDAAAHAGEP